MATAASFTNGPFSVLGVKGSSAVPHIYKQCRNMLGAFVRNKNGNVVVLEGIVTNGCLTGIDSYWLDLEPSYIKSARKKGRLHDRDEFGYWDNKAYGFAVKKLSNTRLQVIMNQCMDKKITVALESNGVNAYVSIDKELCRLNYIYVHDVTQMGLRTVGGFIPKVEYVEIFAYNKNRVEKKIRI
jgi:hypothetical protein